MEPKIVYFKKDRKSSETFELTEIMENGNVLKRTFKQEKDGYHLYSETSSDTNTPKGEIRIEKVSFNSDGTLKKSDIKSKSETVETFKITDWEEARKRVRELQEEVEANLEVDYHSLLVFDSSNLKTKLPTPTDLYEYPIIKLRALPGNEKITRKQGAEKFETAFVPVIDEKLYFHYYPTKNYVNTTGDNIFALDTRVTDEMYSDEDFLNYISFMVDKVNAKPEHFLTLMNMQREQRAMQEAEDIGDLFPR